MALIRWQPFHEMDYLQRDMNRLFDRLTTTNGEVIVLPLVPPQNLRKHLMLST